MLIAGLNRPAALAVHDGVVVLAADANSPTTATSAIIRYTAAAGVSVLATTDHAVSSIAFDDTTVYWTDASTVGVDFSQTDGRLRSVPLAGGAASILLDNLPGPGNLVLLGSTLFFATEGTFSDVIANDNAAISLDGDLRRARARD